MMTGRLRGRPVSFEHMAYFGWLAFLTHMFDWTNGCIAVTNAEMDEIRAMVPNNTAIVTNP